MIRMGETTKGAIRDVLYDLSCEDLVALDLQLQRGKLIEEIMEHDVHEIIQAIDSLGLRTFFLDAIGDFEVIECQTIGKESSEEESD